MDHDLGIAIQKTLAYFDQFSHPLTARELFGRLWGKSLNSEAEFLLNIQTYVRAGLIAEENGYYFLPGRSEIVEERARKFLIQDHKIKLAKKAVYWLRLVPFVKGIFICNTVASGWPHEESDIDLLIIAKPGRLWLARSLFTALSTMLNRRRHGSHVTDHLCLSFYVTSDHLNLASVRVASPDIYLTYWVHELIPLYFEDNLHQEFLTANSWTKTFVPQAEPIVVWQSASNIPRVLSLFKWGVEFILNTKFGQILENKNRAYQLSRISKHAKKGPPHVVVSDNMLKFHENDRREEYQNNWHQKCAALGL